MQDAENVDSAVGAQAVNHEMPGTLHDARWGTRPFAAEFQMIPETGVQATPILRAGSFRFGI